MMEYNVKKIIEFLKEQTNTHNAEIINYKILFRNGVTSEYASTVYEYRMVALKGWFGESFPIDTSSFGHPSKFYV